MMDGWDAWGAWPAPANGHVEARQRAPATGSGGYTDLLVNAILQASVGTGDDSPAVTAALEGVAALYSRAFAAAQVVGAGGLIGPGMMAAVARDLIRHGDSVWTFSEGDRLRLLQASHFDVFGSADPDTWRYELDVVSPSKGSRTRRVPADQVLHFRYAVDRTRPWKGIPPLSWASGTGALLAVLEKVLSDESKGTRGYVLPIPAGGEDTEVDMLKADLRSLGGGTAIVETTAGGWGQGSVASPAQDWRPQRIGPNYPQAVVQLRDDIQRAVGMACGVPLALLGSGDAASLRESWRLFLHGAVAPLGRQITEEASEKLGRMVRIDWTQLWAADVQGRARAFQSMTGGGMDAAAAARLSGLEE